MKRKILNLMLISLLLVGMVSAIRLFSPETPPGVTPGYISDVTCLLNADCTLNNLIVNGNLQVVGNATYVNETFLNTTALTGVNYIQFNTDYDNGHNEGELHWHTDDGTLSLGLPGGSVDLQIGQEQLIRVTNVEGQDLPNCIPVYVTGATGNTPTIKISGTDKGYRVAQATTGITTETISNNQKGYINIQGIVRGCDTSSFVEGQPVYLGSNGTLVTTPAISPLANAFIGIVLNSHATEGEILNLIDVAPLLSDLSDVTEGQINNSVLRWSNETNTWIPTQDLYLDHLYVHNITGRSPIYFSSDMIVSNDSLVYADGSQIYNLNLTNSNTGFLRKHYSGNFDGSLYTTQTDSSLSDSNALFIVESDTRGTPQFLVQNGGPYQASFITRSFIVVNQNNTLLNSSQNNDCRDWGFDYLDCNTATTGADFGVTDDIEGRGLIWSGQGYRANKKGYSSYFVGGDFVNVSTGINGSFTDSNNFFCDYVNSPFVEGDYWIRLLEESTNKEGAYARIDAVVNSSCVVLGGNPTWDFGPEDLSYYVVNDPDVIFSNGGFYQFYVGNNEYSGFEINDGNGTADRSILFDVTSGANNHRALEIDMDAYGFDGTSAARIGMYTSQKLQDSSITMLDMVGDGTNMNFSTGTFIDMSVVGTPANSTLNGIKMDSAIEHLITVGGTDTVSKVYHIGKNITTNVTSIGNPAAIFTNQADVLYIGGTTNFTKMSFILTQVASQNINAIYYYCNNAGGYSTLSVTDGTTGFTSSGSITFNNPTDRGVCNQQIGGTPFADTTNYNYIAIQRTRAVVTPNTPILDLVQVSGAQQYFELKKDILKLQPVSTPSEICDANFLGGMYVDSDLSLPCFCDGSNWVQMDDYATTC